MLNYAHKRLERSNRKFFPYVLACANMLQICQKRSVWNAFNHVQSRRYRHHQKITGKDEVRQHLAELGFVVGETVTIVSEINGNLIIQVKEARIALDKTLAMRIIVG